MPGSKRFINLSVNGSDQMVKIVQGLTELKGDITADSTPSAIKITVYGTKDEVRDISAKIRGVEESSKRT